MSDPSPAELPLASAGRRLRRAARADRAQRPPARRLRRLKWNLREAIELRLKGWTYEALAGKYGVGKSTVAEQLKGVFALLDPQRLEAYESHRAAVLSAAELGILDLLLDPEKQQKATLGNVGYVFTQLHQARRLEVGQSTANVSLHALVEAVEQEEQARRRSGRGNELPSGNGNGNDPQK